MYDYFEFLKAAGVTVLRGDSDLLTIGDNTIVISGVDDPDVTEYDTSYKTYEEQFETITKDINYVNYNILLAHRPENEKQYFDAGFDLVLSGHAHGGQVRVPFILNGLYAPNQGLLPKFAGGIFDSDGQKLIVSRGLSRENTILPRIFNRPELVFISLMN
jgi:predicted MPP superfamily phosphohydrolase